MVALIITAAVWECKKGSSAHHVPYCGCHILMEIPLNVRPLTLTPDKISEFAALEGKYLSSYYVLGPVLSFLPDLSHLVLIKTQ